MLKLWISTFQLARDKIRRALGILLFDKPKLLIPLPSQLNKIVFIRWDAKWGDAIVSSFIFEALRLHYPNTRIEVVTTATMASLFEKDYGIDKVYQIAKRPKYNQLKALAQQINKTDVIVHMSPYLKMKDIYFLNNINADFIIGLDDKLKLINIKLGKEAKNLHFSERFKLILTKLNTPINEINYQIPLRRQSLEKIQHFLTELNLKDFTLLNPFGSGKSRKLNQDNIHLFIELIRKTNENKAIVLLHTPDTKALIQKICTKYQGKAVYYLKGSESIYDAIALIASATEVISVDTSIVHIASGLKKPLLGIYNPDKENYLAWHPNSDKAISFFTDEILPYDINQLNEDSLQKVLKDLYNLSN